MTRIIGAFGISTDDPENFVRSDKPSSASRRLRKLLPEFRRVGKIVWRIVPRGHGAGTILPARTNRAARLCPPYVFSVETSGAQGRCVAIEQLQRVTTPNPAKSVH